MAESLKVVQDHVELTAEQGAAIEAANRLVSEQMAILGQAHLEHGEARHLHERAQEKLRSCEVAALGAEAQRAKIVGALAETLDLGPGEWVYDGNGKMVRKDA